MKQKITIIPTESPNIFKIGKKIFLLNPMPDQEYIKQELASHSPLKPVIFISSNFMPNFTY